MNLLADQIETHAGNASRLDVSEEVIKKIWKKQRLLVGESMMPVPQSVTLKISQTQEVRLNKKPTN